MTGETLPDVNTPSDASALHESDAIAQQESLGYVMGDKHNGRAKAFLEQLELPLQFGAGQGIERSERLIHEQDWRVRRKCASQPNPLPLTARELMRVASRKLLVGQSNQREYLLDSRINTAPIPAFDLRDQRNVTFHRVVGKEADLLNRISDTAAQLNGIPLMQSRGLPRALLPESEKEAGL